MFRLHETTNRRVCRWAFVLLCATPTLAVAAWVVHHHRPWRLKGEQQRLGAALHANVRLANWHEPRPGTVRSAAVELVDIAEATTFASLSKLERRRSGNAAWLAVERIEIDVQQLSSLATRLHLWLLNFKQNDFRFRCEQLILRDPGSSHVAAYRDIEAVVRRSDDGGYQVQFLARTHSDGNKASRLRVTLATVSTAENAGSALVTATLDATEAPVPLWLLAAAAPVGDGWGQEAAYAGSLRIEYVGGQLHGTGSAELRGLDLSAIAAASGAHDAEGQARVQLDEFRWRGAQVERVAGIVHARNIRVSQSVIAAAGSQLLCGAFTVGDRPADQADGLISVDAVSCRFVLDASGLALTGAIPESTGLPAGCIASAAGRPLLTSPQHPRLGTWVQLHPSTWVQFIAAGADGWVPGSREAIEAANRLPLPTATRNTTDIHR